LSITLLGAMVFKGIVHLLVTVALITTSEAKTGVQLNAHLLHQKQRPPGSPGGRIAYQSIQEFF